MKLFNILDNNERLTQFQKTFYQFIKFGIVGFSNTLLSYLLYVVALYLCVTFKMFNAYDYLLALFISFVISVAWSFYWNRRFVFKVTQQTRKEFWKSLFKTYCLYALSGLVIAEILQVLLVEYCEISKWISPIIILIVTVPLNFILNKFWAFR